MNTKWHWLALFVLAWILWERVLDRNTGSEKWRNLTSIQNESSCRLQIQPFVTQAYNQHLYRLPPDAVGNADLGATYYVLQGRSINEVHSFECYPSDADPRPR